MMTRRLPNALREALANAWLVGPATVAMLVLIFGPVFAVAVLSFTDYQLGAQSFAWIGLENYSVLFTDPIGRRAVVNTLIYVAIVMPASMLLALLVALGVHRVASWNATLAGVLRTAYFMPVAGTLVAMATVWQMLMHPNVGLLNQLLGLMGWPGQEWLSDRGIVLYSLAVIGIWETVGYNMVLFLAGLAAIPEHLYAAAEIDGVRPGWDRFWTITWPLLGPTTLFVIVVTAARAFRVFETVATLTRGGPGFASDTLVYAMYREGFVYFKAGYASAVTMVFFAFVLTLTLVQFGLLERRVHYR